MFKNNELKEAIDKGVLGLSTQKAIPHADQPIPFYIAADDYFALSPSLPLYTHHDAADTSTFFICRKN